MTAIKIFWISVLVIFLGVSSCVNIVNLNNKLKKAEKETIRYKDICEPLIKMSDDIKKRHAQEVLTDNRPDKQVDIIVDTKIPGELYIVRPREGEIFEFGVNQTKSGVVFKRVHNE